MRSINVSSPIVYAARDDAIVNCYCVASAITVYLPVNGTCPITVSKADSTSNAVTIAAMGTESIGGENSISSQYGYITFTPVSGGWVVTDSGGANKTETLANKTLDAPVLNNASLDAPVLNNACCAVTVNTHDYGGAAADWTLSAGEALKPVHRATNASGDANAIVGTSSIVYTFINQMGYTLTVKTAAGTGVAIADGKTAMVMAYGGNVIRLTSDA